MYIKCELVKKIKGIGNHVNASRGEFVLTNDDTHEIWKRNGESMKKFKNWYQSIEKTENKITGSYPKYDLR
jgi:ABC-type tungstate transport system permease subunit